tara:strand:+ start:574 stop:1323 length:750 start_codon:yes stop_codon:yes gene_type:complete
MSIFGFLPGADVNSIVQREIDNKDLNSRRSGFADRTGAWNWQDDFGAWMAGTNKAEILRLAKIKANQDLTDYYSPKAGTNAGLLGHLTPEYQGVTNKTKQELDQQIAADYQRGLQLQKTLGQGNITPGDISKTASLGDIMSAGVQGSRDTEENKIKKERAFQKGLRDEIRLQQEGLLERQNEREDRRDARARLESAEARKDNLELRRDNMNLEYARLNQADMNRVQDRRDQAIMALLGGLGNLGAAFTV